MGYILSFIALLAAILWTTPARVHMTEASQTVMRSAQAIIASGSDPFQARIESMAGSVRTKAMELLRKELHQSVDEVVQ
jgi:hypothetical protein